MQEVVVQMKLLLLAAYDHHLDAREEIGNSRLSRTIRVNVRRRGSAWFGV